MTDKTTLTVTNVARLAGVSVRTLHYYDKIGLLVADRSAKDYRLYSQSHMLRLQQILIERSMGRSLEDIRRSLDDPDFDQAANLKAQREHMVARLSQTHKMITAIDTVLAHYTEPEERKTPMDFKSLFDGFDPNEFEVEAKDRWGDTDAWAHSNKRTKGYEKADWEQVKQEQDSIWQACALAMGEGHNPQSDIAQSLVERHRRYIDRWFYPLTPKAHIVLADMWEGDDRFRTNIDGYAPGLTEWIANAIRAAAGEPKDAD